MFNDEKKIKEYVELLGLKHSFNFQDLKVCYRKNVFLYHPDKVQDITQKKKNEQLLKQINVAYDFLVELLKKNNGEYSFLDVEEKEIKSEQKKKTSQEKESKQNNTQPQYAIDEEFYRFFRGFEYDFDEYFEHLNTDSDKEFEEYIKNLYKNLKDKDAKNTIIKDELDFRKQKKFDENFCYLLPHMSSESL